LSQIGPENNTPNGAFYLAGGEGGSPLRHQNKRPIDSGRFVRGSNA
jgi:hypothetical protein